MKEKNTTDARTLAEISEGLTADVRNQVRYAIVGACQVSEQTVRNWMDGKFPPLQVPTRNQVAKVVSDKLGIKVTGESLFQ